MYKSLDSFRGEAKISTWLYRVTLNSWLDIKRTLKFKMFRSHELFEEEITHNGTNAGESPDSKLEKTMFRDRIESLLKKLSAKERAAFVLRHYHDRSIPEIGELMKLSTGTVKSLLFRSVKKMRTHLVKK